MQQSRPVTSSDVALAAGVSRSTVSFVLNGNDTIALADETRERVRRVARELGYVPHSGARALRKGYSSLVLMPSPSGPVGHLLSPWTDQLEEALSAHGLTFVTYGSRHLAPADAARAWSELRPVAVLTIGGLNLPDDAVALLRRTGTRVLITTGETPQPGILTLITQQAEAGRIAVEHLIATGRRSLAVLIPRDRQLQHIARSRASTARSAAQARGVRLTELSIDYTRESAEEVAAALSSAGIDGVYAYDDDYALLLLGTLRSQGVDVPGSVAVVGSDDLVAGSVAQPPLTTVRIAFPHATVVADDIHRLITDPTSEPGCEWAEAPRLVVRETTAPI